MNRLHAHRAVGARCAVADDANLARVACIALLTLLAACDGVDGASDMEQSELQAARGTLLSSPVPRSALADGGGTTGTLVFVATKPGTFTGAVQATVVGAGGDVARALLRDGGFDPLPVAGSEGSAIRLLVSDSAGRTVEQTFAVKGRTPPRVVRSSPTVRQADVPLNIRLEVTFTTPISRAAMDAVHLLEGGREVAGTVQLSTDAMRVEFLPAELLSARTAYELRVEANARDVLGTPIGDAVSVPFVTGTTVDPLVAVEVVGFEYPWEIRYVNAVRLEVGETRALESIAFRPTGVSLGEPTRWTSSNPSVVRVAERAPGVAVEQGINQGEAIVRAQIENLTAEFHVRVGPLPDGVREAQVWWTDHRGDVWREPVLGGVGFRVFAVAELPGDRTLCNGGWGPRCYFPEHEFATTPDGQIAITRASGIGGVWIKNLGATPRRVNDPAERGAAHGPAWSLDGRRLAYWFDYFDQAMTELRVVNRDGTGSRVLLRMPYDTTYPPCGPPCIMDWGSKRLGPNAVVWHADGQRLLMATSEGTQQVPISGAAPSMYLAGFHPGPWFPNGQTQFVIDLERAPTGNPLVSDYRVFRADAAGIVRRASEFQTSLPPIAISPDGLLMADQDSVYPLNRRDGFEVTGSDHLLGFAR